VADASGAYRVRVPYANDGGPHGIRTGPFYRIACAGEVGVAVVTEALVVEGGRAQGPTLCLGGGR
jgi:hypothetical protein